MNMPKLNYTHINHLARIQLGLSMNEYAVADLIYHYSNNPESPIPGWCFANKKTISEKLGLTERSVFAILTKLEAKKIVERHSQTHHLRVTSLWYKLAYTIQETPSADTHQEIDNHHEESSESMRVGMKILHTDHEGSSVDTMKKVHADYEVSSYNNNRENNIQKNINTSPNGEGESPHVESREMQIAISEPEEKPMVGESVNLGKDGSPLKPRRNSDGSFGNMGINEAMNILVRLLGHAPNKSKLNRIAAQNLFKRYGQEATLERMAVGYAAYRADRFAPRILNYMDLWDNWDALDRYLNLKGISADPETNRLKQDNPFPGVSW
jgi:hypothetical protein